MTAQDLIDFEEQIAAEFNDGKIRFPIHLSSGNEQQLIDIFKEIRQQDYIFCSWRSHLHALLKGVPPDKLRAAIYEGRSIALCFPEHRMYSSAIVGGIVPIALGVALAIKRAGGSERCWCFVGDMTAQTGIFHECKKYASNQGLRTRFIIEDNDLSVCTPTFEAWGEDRLGWHGDELTEGYIYISKWPHSGAGRRIEF